jgi:hypothetical protein
MVDPEPFRHGLQALAFPVEHQPAQVERALRPLIPARQVGEIRAANSSTTGRTAAISSGVTTSSQPDEDPRHQTRRSKTY